MLKVIGNVISQKVEHKLCHAEVKAIDRRGDGQLEFVQIYFELQPGYDEEKDPDGFIKVGVEKILKSLGYYYCGMVHWDTVDLEYKANKKYEELQ